MARGPAHADGAHDAWLVRASDAATKCAACGRAVGAWRYRCGTCRVDFHPRCLVPAADQCRGGAGADDDAPATVSSKAKSGCLGLVHDLTNCVVSLATTTVFRNKFAVKSFPYKFYFDDVTYRIKLI
ncbi:hypothetical protein ABZP36_009018 [Zizania latifolia]